jgi:hypothetical protein
MAAEEALPQPQFSRRWLMSSSDPLIQTRSLILTPNPIDRATTARQAEQRYRAECPPKAGLNAAQRPVRPHTEHALSDTTATSPSAT